MTAPCLSAVILAVGPSIWSFHTWRLRTQNLVPPFDIDATPSNTHLESWQLTVIKNLTFNIHSLPTYDERIRFILQAQKALTKFHHAPDTWDTWVNGHIRSWSLQIDIERILYAFGRHPSQTYGFPTETRLDDLIPLVPFIAEELFGADAYMNPTVPQPIVKHELHKFIIDLLRIVWNSAVATEH
ncbi:hypothetical protein EDB85DRAFT_1898653 [Lactarius pseudohatsudake]|nr:hypothetical protein EDB85DRAFT_1898653 [Lactarius pseudohatsudake]